MQQDFRTLWVFFQKAGEGGEQAVCAIKVFLVSRYLAQAEQIEGHDGISRRDGAIVDFLGSDEEFFPVIRSEKEPPFFLVLEMNEGEVGEFLGRLQVSGVEGRLIQIDQALGEKGIVFQVGGQTGLSLAPSLEQPTILASKLLKAEISRFSGNLDICLFVKRPSATGEGGDHQPIPVRQHFIVFLRMNSTFPSFE